MPRQFALVGLLAFPLLAAAPPTLRHLALRRSEPANGSRLTAAPNRISLWFTAKPQAAFSRIGLVGPLGAIALDTVVADTAHSLHARIPGVLAPGEYRVRWQTASADAHPIRGEFAFAVVTGEIAGTTTGVSTETPPHAGHDQVAAGAQRDESGYRTARWIEFAALLTVLGALGFRHGVLPPLAARGVPTADAADRARRLGQSVLALYAVAALVRLYTQSAALHGPERALETETLLRLLTLTTWGIGWSAGVVGAVLLLAGWWVSKRSVTIGTPLALTGALAIALSPALSGHAASSPRFVLSVTLDTLHVVAAGVWLGGLVMVLFAGVPAMLRLTNGNQHAAVSALVNSFHPIALFCAPLVVIAGLGTSWLRLGGLGALWPTAYGRTLVLKIGLVTLLAIMGAYNSVRARRRLGGADGEGTRHFRLSGLAELTIGALVVIVTTFLVITPVPSDMGPP